MTYFTDKYLRINHLIHEVLMELLSKFNPLLILFQSVSMSTGILSINKITEFCCITNGMRFYLITFADI